MIVRRQVNGKRPLKAILEVLGRDTVSRFRPRLYSARHFRLQVEAFKPRVVTAAPHRTIVDRVRNGPAAFATAYRTPHANGTGATRIAWPAIRIAVLPVAVEVVGNFRVGGHVIHLRIGQRDPRKRLASIDRDAHATIIAHHETIGIFRIPPDVVQVAAGSRWACHLGEPAVAGADKAHAHEEHVIGVGRVDTKASVILWTLQQIVITIDGAP